MSYGAAILWPLGKLTGKVGIGKEPTLPNYFGQGFRIGPDKKAPAQGATLPSISK